MILEVKNMKKSFPEAGEVLKNINLSVDKGDVIAVIGPSGGGKTTMLRCLNFLETPDSGTMIFDGAEYDLRNISKSDIYSIRKHTGFVFQNYNLFLNKTAIQNVAEGLVTARKMNKKEARAKAELALTNVGLADRLDYYPNRLSGGQQQRVAIARAMATDPEIIYFDEPTSALDPELTREVLDVIRRLAGEGRTMVVVTHELEFARNIATRIAFMEDGEIVTSSDPETFFSSVNNERIEQFLSNIKIK